VIEDTFGTQRAKLPAGDLVLYELRHLPAYGTRQLFFFDPDNAKVEIDFDKAEAAPAAGGEAKAWTKTY
jgi:hypothetical protein